MKICVLFPASKPAYFYLSNFPEKDVSIAKTLNKKHLNQCDLRKLYKEIAPKSALTKKNLFT